MRTIKTTLLSGLFIFTPLSYADFVDDFNQSVAGWQSLTGDGEAQLKFVPMDGFARMQVDATKDQHTI